MSLCLCPFQKKLKMKTFKYLYFGYLSFSVCVSVFFLFPWTFVFLPLLLLILLSLPTHNTVLVVFLFVCFSNMAMSYRGWSQRARTIVFVCFWRDLLLLLHRKLYYKKLGSDFVFFGWRSFVVDVAASWPRSARSWVTHSRFSLTDALTLWRGGSLSLSFRRKICTNTWTRNLAWSRFLLFWTVCFQLDFCLNYSIIFTSNFRVVCVTVKRQAKIKDLLLLFLLPLLGFYYLLYLKLS